jgi:ParB family chromosome partitioning protein
MSPLKASCFSCISKAVETSIAENLQRRDVHALEEAQGFAALMRLEEPKHSIEQIAVKCAKSPAFVALDVVSNKRARLELVEVARLLPEVV